MKESIKRAGRNHICVVCNKRIRMGGNHRVITTYPGEPGHNITKPYPDRLRLHLMAF